MNDEREVYSYTPEDGKIEANVEKKIEEVKIVYNKPSLAVEIFNKKLFSPEVEDEKSSKYVQFVEADKSNQPSASSKRFESPYERIDRLKRDLDDFTKQLKLLAKGDALKDVTSGSVHKDIDDLEMDFGAILNDTRISPFLPNDAPLPKSTLRRPDSELACSIVAQLGSFGGKGPNGATYELLYRDKKGEREMRLNEVDRRLRAIEKKVGTVGKDIGFQSMHKALGDLYSRLELLQGSNIDTLTRRIASMNAELNVQKHLIRIKGAKGGEQKINELYALMQKKNGTVKELQSIAAALQVQDSHHTPQVDAVLRLQKLQRTQVGLSNILKEDNKVLTDVSTNMVTNLKVLKGNIENFQNRFVALEQKLNQL